MRKMLIVIAACRCRASAAGARVGGVKLDDKASVGGQELVLNGAAVRTRAIFKVYVGSLYVPAKAADVASVLAKGPRRIQLNILRNLTPDQFVGRAGRRPEGQQFRRRAGRGQGADRPVGRDDEGRSAT